MREQLKQEIKFMTHSQQMQVLAFEKKLEDIRGAIAKYDNVFMKKIEIHFEHLKKINDEMEKLKNTFGMLPKKKKPFWKFWG